MPSVIGILIVFVMVFGGYLAAGGHLDVILKSLPYEMMIIGGAAVGAFAISNDMAAIKGTLRDFRRVFKGAHWQAQDYEDLLCLLSHLIRMARNNPVDLEEHIEDPEKSPIFQAYPRILADGEVRDLICDTLRSASMNYDDPHQVEEVLDKRLDAHLDHALHSAHALDKVADGLPALGIVAAVLGVIKTMGSIDQPPEILGKLIAGALVGTFLGVFLAYGFVGPFAARIKQSIADDAHFYHLVREVLVANLHQHSVNNCIEVGRQNMPAHHRPSFSALEQAIKEARKEFAA